MYKEKTKYKLIGYRVVGVDYNVPREEIAEYKKGTWFLFGRNKKIKNFVIDEVIEINETNAERIMRDDPSMK
jgi:hypothetical protein